MPLSYRSPGVYHEEIFLQPEAALPVGVPGFVGFAAPPSSGLAAPAGPVALHRPEEFSAQFGAVADGYLAEAVGAFFANGGQRCYAVAVAAGSNREASLKGGIDALAPLTDMDLVVVPDATTLTLDDGRPDPDAITRVQQYALDHCAAQGDRFCLLDSWPGANASDVLAQASRLLVGRTEPLNGALYYPWVRNTAGRLVPPTGAVAGIYARVDAARGVHKAPANEELLGVLDLEWAVDQATQEQLHPAGVNCLRAFAGRGLRVWGARTLSRQPEWRYVNVRRLFLTLGRWIEANMRWANFEANAPRLWVRVQRELGAYLVQLWRTGALQGLTPEQAFYIKCDAETNPPQVRENGAVVTEVGLAPLAPAEFVVVRIIHRAGAS